MAIHWLADACVAGALFLAAQLVYSYLWPVSREQSPNMRRSRLHAALESSRTGAWVWEVGSRHFFCDTRACQNLGAPPGSLLRLDDFIACVAPSDRQRVGLEMQRASAANEPFELVARIKTADGVERFVALEGRPETNVRGEPIRITGSLRDVTEEQRRIAELGRQSQILAQVHDAIFAASPTGRILSWNEAAERMYGYRPEEAIGRNLGILWFEEDRGGLENNLSAAAVASGAHEFVSRVRHKSGSELYAHFRLARMRDAQNETIGLLACSFDVTRQREEHELLTLQASALENIDEAVLVSDKLEKIIHANEAAGAMFSRPGHTLQGAAVHLLLTGRADDRVKRMADIRAAVLRDGKWSGELSCARLATAKPILARASVRLIDLDSGPVWVWVLQDVTERRRAEAALIEREKRFRELANSAPMMVWMTDLRGDCEYVNDAWLSQAEMTWRQAQGPGWLQAIHPEDRPAFERMLRPKSSPPQAFETELRMLGSDGQAAFTLTRGAPRREAGAVVGFVGSAVDISNIKKAEEERIQLEQQALKSQKLHSLGVLAGGIAHDFNNMLVSILGFSDLALRELEPRHPARKLVEQIELGSRRAAALVEQVLTFAGKARRANEDVDLNEAVVEMVNLLERSLRPGVSFDLQLNPNLSTFLGDPAQVRQVVMNLVLNASDALTGAGGRISIRTDVQHVVPGEGTNWAGDQPPAGACILLEVDDDGCGIDSEALSQIFDPFFTTKFTGRGLGLSAVMGVVRSHSGAIQVDSAVDRGSRFRVLFPVARRPLPDPGQPRAAGDGEPCVLAVDDDPTVLEASRQMLQSGGVKVFCAQSQAEAAAKLERNADQIRLVILDVVMPDASAAAIVSRLLEIRGDIQILLTSGYSDPTLRPPIDGRTIVGFLPKPYTRDELLEAIALACPAIVRDLAEDSAAV